MTAVRLIVFLLYSPKDVRLNRFMIENSEGNDELTIEENEQIRERDFERLKYMTFYSTTNDCLRGFILRYFGGEKRLTAENAPTAFPFTSLLMLQLTLKKLCRVLQEQDKGTAKQ